MSESIESSRFVSHWERMSGEFDWRKDLETRKFERRPQIFLKLSFKELSSSKLCGLQAFDYMVIYHSSKLVSAILYQTFSFYQTIVFQKLFLFKMSLFNLKSSFGSWDIQIFVFWPPLFFSLSAIALEVDPRKTLKFTTSSTV